MFNTGNGTYTLTPVPLPLLAGGTLNITLADADSDGDLDVFRGLDQGQAALAINDGTGLFVDASARLPKHPAGNYNLVVADLDGDGDPDILVADLFAPRLWWNRHRDVSAGPANLGQPWTVEVWSQPGYATAPRACALGVGLVRRALALQLLGIGGLWLDLGTPLVLQTAVLASSAGSQPFVFALPPAPSIVGVELQVQALLEEAPGLLRLTSFDAVVIQ
ncbi:MAG: VCBS repeat-containing protein [Planctomycetota bacterium]